MKRLFIIMSISSLLVLGGYSFYESQTYTLKNNERALTEFIHEQLGSKKDELLLLDIFHIEDTNKMVATFEYKQNKLGAVIFVKGFLGKLKHEKFLLERSYYSEVIYTKVGTSVLFIGENFHSSVKTIETDIVSQGDRVKLSVPPQKYFHQILNIEDALKINAKPTYIYRHLKGAIAGADKELEDMELMFVNESQHSFLIYSETNAVLKTVMGSYHQDKEGFVLTGVEEPNHYSMDGEKDFCFEKKKIRAHDMEQTYLHGLVPKGDEVEKVVFEVERKEKVIYQYTSNVVGNQFLIHISIPEVLESDGKLVKKFHFYDKNGNYIRTEMKS